MTASLSNILKHGAAPMAPRIVIYGMEGVGKSTLASRAYKPVFIPTESGLVHLDVAQTPRPEDYETFREYCEAIANEPGEFKTVVIDTADWLEVLIQENLCKKFKADYIEKADGGYGKGHAYAANMLRGLLLEIDNWFSRRGIGVVFCAHAIQKTINDVEIGTIEQYTLKMQDKTRAVLKEWADAVLFLTRRNGTLTGTQKVENPRELRCERTIKYEAKNRFGLPEVLPADSAWETIYNCYKITTKGEKSNG